MERVEAKLMTWKGLYDELGRVQAQIAAALEAGDFERVSALKDEAVRLAMRNDAALDAVHEALNRRRNAASATQN